MSWYMLFSAFWLGLLTAISPCPLASNIAAVSFIGRHVGKGRHVLLSGFFYTAGRTFTYVVLGAFIAGGLLASGALSRFLQEYMNEILGPLLILLGMLLLNMLGSAFSINIINEKIQKNAEKRGIWYAFPLGILFALSFCPVSAGLFFGALIPLSISNGSTYIFPLVYGVGTALPVALFACLIAFGGKYLGSAFNCLTKIELWFRYTAGILFILTGIYYCLVHIYGIL